MSNHTLCENRACPIRSKCQRGSGKPNDGYQAYDYFDFGMIDGEAECFYFLELDNVKWK